MRSFFILFLVSALLTIAPSARGQVSAVDQQDSVSDIINSARFGNSTVSIDAQELGSLAQGDSLEFIFEAQLKLAEESFITFIIDFLFDQIEQAIMQQLSPTTQPAAD